VPDYAALRKRVDELATRDWDEAGLQARIRRMAAEGIPAKTLNPDELLAHRDEILDRVQRRAEEYNFILKNCAKGTALALMEEFGLGNMDIVKALSPFPGFGGTGWMCGGVTGGLVALGLFFGSEDALDYEATAATIGVARDFMPRFEEELGAVVCPKIQEEVIFGCYMDPAASEQHMEAFAMAKGFEKCSVVPGRGARLAASLIIGSME
jgi:C_GCAxxG_C_C family probable redox protein